MIDGHAVIADLGCGTGALSHVMAPWVQSVFAVDSSSAMLQAARKRLRDFDNIHLLQGELTALPLKDGECDIAALALVLPYVESPSRVLAEAARPLSAEGGLSCSTCNRIKGPSIEPTWGIPGLDFKKSNCETGCWRVLGSPFAGNRSLQTQKPRARISS